MSIRNPQNIVEVSKERIALLDEERKHPELYAPVSTGLLDLDRIIGGLPLSDPFIMVILAAKKLGKTTLAMHLAHQWCLASGKPAMFFSLEELRYQFADRHVANMSDISRRKMFMRNLSAEDIARMYVSVNKMSELLWIQDSVYTIDEAVIQMEAKGCTFGIFDNMQLHSRQGIPGASDREKLEYIGRQLIYYRNEKKLSLIAVSQESDKNRAFGSDEILRGMDFGLRMEECFEATVNEKGKPVNGDVIEYQRDIEVMRARNMGSGTCTIGFDGAHNRVGNLGGVKLGGTSQFDLDRFNSLIDGKQVLG